MSALISRTVTSAARAAWPPERDVAGASRHVEMAKPRPSRRIEHGDEPVLPESMQAGRHQVVHDVVAPGHLLEHVVDPGLLVVETNVLEAEMGRLVGTIVWAGHHRSPRLL
jgi:hypothetical protein